MSSTEVRTSRIPEIENIALREALKDFGLERVTTGDDIVAHIGRGPKGLFVSTAEKSKVSSDSPETVEKIAVAGTAGGGLTAELVAAIPNLRNFAVLLCGNAEQADDLVQVTLARAWAVLPSFTQGMTLTEWLSTILCNIYNRQYRGRSREMPDMDASQERNASLDFLSFHEALEKLPDDQTEALALVAAAGLSFDYGLDALARATDMMSVIVDETKQDLIEIEMRRKQIDRTQARTREILIELTGQGQ